MNNRMPPVLWLSVCLLAALPTVLTSQCDKDATVCEFWLEISHKMTMMHERTAVFPENGRLYHYDVTNTSNAEPVNPSHVITADGWEQQRLVIVANGTMPGPAIEVYENQTVVVHVTNKMTSTAVSVHWHGIHQKNTPWMDGVAYVTQCPIEPHATFSYVFKAYPRGTFWYHSHIGTQVAMGMFGALIIRDREPEPMEEHVMLLQEWNHKFVGDLIHMRMVYGAFDNRIKQQGSKSLEGASFSLYPFNSALINGRGRYYFHNGSHNGAPLSTFNVGYGQSYRFRLIGAAGLYPFRLSVDGHELILVASDGFDIDPVKCESVIVNPGERYDFILHANQHPGNYWIRSETLEVDVENHRADAILRYPLTSYGEVIDPTTQRKACSETDRCLVVNCPFQYYPADQYTDCLTVGALRSRHDPKTPGYVPDISGATPTEADTPQEEEEIEDIFLNFGFAGNKSTPGSVNGRAFTHPSVSALTQPHSFDHSTCESDLCGEEKICHCPYVISLEYNKVYNLVFTNMGKGRGWNHPIHMHGHSFHVIKTGYPQYNITTGKKIEADNPDIDCRGNPVRHMSFCNNATWANSSWGGNNIPGAELDRPPVKDTVQCPTGGYVVVRLRADNPGLWLLHCHVGLHQEDGMTLMVNESYSRHPRPPRGFPTCGDFKVDTDEMRSLIAVAQLNGLVEDGNDEESSYAYDLFSGHLENADTTSQQAPHKHITKTQKLEFFDEFVHENLPYKSDWLAND